MNETNDLKRYTDFLCFISEATKPLSSDSIRKIFSEGTIVRISQCKSTPDFFKLIDSLNLPELSKIKLSSLQSERSEMTNLLDSFLLSGKLPADEQISFIINGLQQPDRKSLTDNVVGSAMAGAAVGAGAGAFGAGLVTSPVGGIGAPVGAMLGAMAGAVGGAIGGVINYAIGRN